MNRYIIISDNTTDLPLEYIQKRNLPQTALTILLNGKEYRENWQEELGEKTIYDEMRKGALPTTMQVNPEQMKDTVRPYLQEGLDVLYLAFSSGLSGSYHSECIAAQELLEEFPERKILVVDTLSASLGQGLLVHKALNLRDEGKTMEEVAQWVEAHRQNICQCFTVDDLNHLYRGGRVSKTSAVVGTMIGIKPVLHINEEGKLIPIAKVRGRKQSITALVDCVQQRIGKYNTAEEEIFISHGDCLEEAHFLKELLEQKLLCKVTLINFIGPVIASHAGCGTLAVFFMGEKR